MNGYYRLEGHEVIPVASMMETFCEPDQRRVAKTEKDGVQVSTVFLMIDHAYGGGTPVLFETMVFGGENDGDCERYHTWDEAEAGHAEMCKKVGLATELQPSQNENKG